MFICRTEFISLLRVMFFTSESLLLFFPVFYEDARLSCGDCYNLKERKQDSQLSQRDRAAGCVIVFAESRTLELGDNDLRTL